MSIIDSNEIKKQLKIIFEIIDTIPENYREKAFEILLSNYLKISLSKPDVQPIPIPPVIDSKQGQYIIPIAVKAFFQQYGLPENIVEKLFMIEGSSIFPIYTLKTTKYAQAQVQLSLLLALENALHDGKFTFNVETVRERCKERKTYDKNNFKSNFKIKLVYYKDINVVEVELTPDGKSELADVIREITSNG